MSRRGRALPESNNLAIGILFCLFIAVLIIGSFALKAFDIIRKSAYDADEHFTLAISDTKEESDYIRIISFTPQNASASILSVPRRYQTPQGTKILSAYNVGAFLAIPVDGAIMPKNGNTIDFLSDEKTDAIMQKVLLNYHHIMTNLTLLDVGRLYLQTKALSTQSVKEVELEENLEDVQLDKVASSLFSDDAIESEKLSIEIINAAEVGGLGNRFARYVTNGGGNVVAVSTAEESAPLSEIQYSGEESYTVKKLSKILRIPAHNVQEKGISDIIITIGRDKASFFE